METAPVVDPFLDQEVRRTGVNVHGRGRPDRTAVQVRRNLNVAGFRHGGNLARLQDAARNGQVELQDGCRLLLKHGHELELVEQALARGHGDARGAGHPGHLRDVLRRHRLLEPERIELLHPLGKPNGAVGVELSVRADQNVAAVADGLPHLAHHQGRVAQALQAVRGARVHGIELDGGEPLVHVGQGHLGGLLARITGAPARQIGVGPQPIVHAAAQQVVDGLAGGLAGDVPQRNVDGAEDGRGDGADASDKPLLVDAVPDLLDLERILSHQILLGEIVNQGQGRVVHARVVRRFADAGQAFVGADLDEQPARTAESRRRVVNQKRLDRVDFHGRFRFGSG